MTCAYVGLLFENLDTMKIQSILTSYCRRLRAGKQPWIMARMVN